MNKRIIGVFLALVICIAAIAPAIAIDWQQFHYDDTNVGTTASDAPDDNNLLWTSSVIGAVDGSSTVIAEGKVFVYCDGALKALDEFTGIEQWSVPIPTSGLDSWHSPTYHDGCVFITAGTNVYCRYASDGFEKWTWPIPSGHESCNGGTTVADGKVVVGDWDGGHYYCIDEATGTILYWTKDVGGYAQGTPAYADGDFYLTSWAYPGGHVYCVDSDDGSENWHTPIPEDTCGSVALSTELGLLYVTTYDFYGLADLHALYMVNGTEKWSRDEEISGTDSTPAVAGEYIYLCAGCQGYSDLYTYCYDAVNGGPYIWRTNLGDEIGSWTCSPAVADGKVFVGKGSGFMGHAGTYALNVSTGDVEWNSNVGGASPAVADGIVFTIADGRVYAHGTAQEVEPPVTPFVIYGETFDNASVALDDCTVTIENLDTDENWTAQTSETSNYYLLLITSEDVCDGNTLRITAKKMLAGGYTTPENYTYCINISTVNVTQNDINMGGFSELDLVLDHFCINYYPDYPYYTQNAWNYSGAAVIRMWTEFKDVGPYTQEELQVMGLANNREDSDPYNIDPQGMAQTLIDLLPNNFVAFTYDNSTEGLERAMHSICWWQYLGPGSLPAYGNPSPDGYYDFWMGVRGIHTDKNPHEGTYGAPYGYDVFGFWVNDPNALASGCIGENSYKTATEWTGNYYKPTYDPRISTWNDKYIAVLEPPEQDADVRIVPARQRLKIAIEPVLMQKTLNVDGIERMALVEAVQDEDALDVVKAAIDAVTEELVPYDTQFADVFAKTVAGEPMLVSSNNGDYYLVPFEVPLEKVKPMLKKPVQIQKVDGNTVILLKAAVDGKLVIGQIPVKPIRIDEERTLVVVLVDAEDGSFKEASWVDDPMKYLPVSKEEALKLVLNEQKGEKNLLTKRPMMELVKRDVSSYYPDWKITIGKVVFFVSQDGEVTSNMPVPIPEPKRKPVPVKSMPVKPMSMHAR